MGGDRDGVLGTLLRGLAAGAAGTAAMTAWQNYAPRLQNSNGGESSTGTEEDPWASAPAPAKVGKRLLEEVFHRDVPASWIPVLANVMHWGYGVGWGAMYAIAQERSRRRPFSHGVAFGAAVWAASYGELVPLGIYEPPWRYPLKTLAFDLSYHAVYGAAVGAAFAALD